MDRMKQIELRRQEIRTLLEGTGEADIAALTIELKALNAEKDAIEQRKLLLASIGAGTAEVRAIEKPEDVETRTIPAVPAEHKKLNLYRNVGEQLKSIRQFAMTGNIDERLMKLNKEERAASGMNQLNPSEGGFALQTDFGGMMMDSAVTTGQILSRVDTYEIGQGAKGVEFIEIDEESISDTVFGGVQVYWDAEAEAATASKPKLKKRKLELLKLVGLAYATDEMMEDTNFISELYSRAFEAGIIRKFEGGIIAGTGAGMPLGCLNANNKISQAKETGQAADTIIWENIVKMFNRRLVKPTSKFGWVCHPDAREQFDFMTFPLGVGGIPIYLQESIAGSIASLKGLPIIESDLCSALGDEGDIMLVDFNDILAIRKGGIKTATSIHVLFTTSEQAFRFTFRANAEPKSKSALTIKNSTKTRSGIITPAARA